MKDDLQGSIQEARAALQGGVPEDDEVMLRAVLGNNLIRTMGSTLADAMEQRGPFDEAVREIETALSIDARGGYHYFESRVQRKANLERLQIAYGVGAEEREDSGDRAGAIAYLEEKLALFDYIPGTHMPTLHNTLGTLYVRNGQSERARLEFQKAFEAESLGEYDSDQRESAAHNLGTLRSSTPAKSGCFIATSVYGSDDCRQVRILRRYRDEVLAAHVLGRVLVRLYTLTSPFAARMLHAVPVVKRLVRVFLLDPVVGLVERKVGGSYIGQRSRHPEKPTPAGGESVPREVKQ